MGSYSPLEVHLRAHTVALEGQFTGFVSLAASGFSAVSVTEVGPGVLFIMGGAYVGSNLVLSSAWEGVNEEFVFPLIHNTSESIYGN